MLLMTTTTVRAARRTRFSWLVPPAPHGTALACVGVGTIHSLRKATTPWQASRALLGKLTRCTLRTNHPAQPSRGLLFFGGPACLHPLVLARNTRAISAVWCVHHHTCTAQRPPLRLGQGSLPTVCPLLGREVTRLPAMDLLELDVQVHPKFGLGALLTLRAIDLSAVDEPACRRNAHVEADGDGDEDSPDPFGSEASRLATVNEAGALKKWLQVDKLQPRGSAESAGVRVGDVFLRVRAAEHPQNPPGTDIETWMHVTSHAELKSAYHGRAAVRVAVARDRELVAAQAAAVATAKALVSSMRGGAQQTAAAAPAGKAVVGGGGMELRRTSSGVMKPVMMSQVETEAELRTKELLDTGLITQEEYDSIVTKTRQRRLEQARLTARQEAIRRGNVIVEAKFGKAAPLGITLHSKGGCVVHLPTLVFPKLGALLLACLSCSPSCALADTLVFVSRTWQARLPQVVLRLYARVRRRVAAGAAAGAEQRDDCAPREPPRRARHGLQHGQGEDPPGGLVVGG